MNKISVKMSSKGQMVIPLDMRKQYGLREGARVELTPWDNDSILITKSKDRKNFSWAKWAEEMHGLGKEIWEGVDPVKYTHELWEKQN